MQVSRSGFYKWQKRVNHPSDKDIAKGHDVMLFLKYHEMYPSHGYRWLNAKIRLDTGQINSDQYAHKCCKYAGIRSKSSRYRYKKSEDKEKSYPNIILRNLNIKNPLEVVVSDMTAFYIKGIYHELTLYMDLYNNELIGHSLSSKRGDPKTYYEGLIQVLDKKKEYPNLDMILHSDQGSVYSSKSFNELLPNYNITRTMSRAGTPTDNGAMEAINGWLKEELFLDFNIKATDDATKAINDYIHYYNYERPACALNYMTPIQFKEMRLQRN